MTRIHLHLRQIRRAHNYSQELLAKKLGISRQALIALEQGESLPSLPVVLALLRVLDMPFDSLFRARDWSPFRRFVESSPEGSALAHYHHGLGRQTIPIAIGEDPKTLTVTAELPGVKEEDVTIDLGTQYLVLFAFKRPPQGVMKTAIHQEIAFGPLLRIISLPCPIDPGRAHAQFTGGVLRLTVPKLTPQLTRRITLVKESSRRKKAPDGSN